MRTIEIAHCTGNNTLYNKAIKKVKANKGDINCSICRYHKGENKIRWYDGKHRTWKDHRKHQYKPVWVI